MFKIDVSNWVCKILVIKFDWNWFYAYFMIGHFIEFFSLSLKNISNCFINFFIYILWFDSVDFEIVILVIVSLKLFFIYVLWFDSVDFEIV